jgi:putative flippase GtrA
VRALISQGVRFGLAGVVGLLVNIAVVYLARLWVNLTLSAALAFLVAATVTWQLNRNFTFRPRPGEAPAGAGLARQWLAYMAANALGGVLYVAIFSLLTGYVPVCRQVPALAVCAGAGLTMVVNFYLSKRVVFARRV